jgi:hypothetical protein
LRSPQAWRVQNQKQLHNAKDAKVREGREKQRPLVGPEAIATLAQAW